MKLRASFWPADGSVGFIPSAWLLSRVAAGLALGFVSAAHSATNTVTSLADFGSGSLRQVIANSAAGDAIVFGVTGTITLGGELVVSNNITVAGPGSSALAISGNHACRVLNVSPSATVSISALTIQDGQTPAGINPDSSGPGGGICNAGTLSISHCVICGNSAGGHGGGIYNQGSCVLIACGLSNNSAGGNGGGIYNCGACVVSNCDLRGNSTADGSCWTGNYGDGVSGGDGAGIYSDTGLSLINSTLIYNVCGAGGPGAPQGVTGYGGDGGSGGGLYGRGDLTGCTIAFNRAGAGGSGYWLYAGYIFGGGGAGGLGGGVAGSLRLTNCTIVGNFSGAGGTGLPFGGPPSTTGQGGNGGGLCLFAMNSGDTNLAIVACTIVSNTAGWSFPPGFAGVGGGVWASGAAALDDLIALNTLAVSGVTGSDVFGSMNSLGHNLIGSGSTGFTAPGDLVGTNPNLGPLANNGGPTWTMALLPGSPAIDAGSAVGTPATDQRGVARPQGPGVDIGAFEYQYIPAFTDMMIQNVTNCWLQMAGLSPAQSFALQVSSNLLVWSAVTNFVGTNGFFQYVDSSPCRGGNRFYRLKSGGQ
jgi:predicted outer membrane repeat protein